LMGVSSQAASYVLIQPEEGANVEQLAINLNDAISEANILSQAKFIASDQEMIRQMGADILQMMNVIAYLIGLIVIGITVYTSIQERVHEFGVLKAIGANFMQLIGTVFVQSVITGGVGFVAGVGLAYIVSALVPRVSPEILILIEPQQWLAHIPVFIIVTGFASLLPVLKIKNLDPLIVFKT